MHLWIYNFYTSSDVEALRPLASFIWSYLAGLYPTASNLDAWAYVTMVTPIPWHIRRKYKISSQAGEGDWFSTPILWGWKVKWHNGLWNWSIIIEGVKLLERINLCTLHITEKNHGPPVLHCVPAVAFARACSMKE